jgi:hypothetical protein
MNKLLLGLALAGLAGTSAKAINYSDTDLILAALNSTTPTYDAAAGTANNDFNIVVDDVDVAADNVGYVPGTPLFNVKVGFTFATSGSTYNVSYTLGSTSSGSIVGVPTGTTFSAGGFVGAIAVSDLELDGILEYTVSWVSGPEFLLTSARLTAETRSSTVPDGGSTVMLLGSTLMGMAAMARRKK